MTSSQRPGASHQPGTHPRPQLLRTDWAELGGAWNFRYDDDNRGIDERWFDAGAGSGSGSATLVFDRQIQVPFPPESAASGIHDTGFHPVVWYQRTLTAGDFAAAGLGSQGDRVWVRFGAVDYRASVWLNGLLLGVHEGGHTPFGFELGGIRDLDRDTHSLVVRAEDDPFDVGQPRGKQDWQLEPHAVWYHRTTGIWQPVWLEAVPEIAIDHLAWEANLADACVELSVELSRRPRSGRLEVEIDLGSEQLASLSLAVTTARSRVRIPLDRAGNGQDYEQLLWSPEIPRLLDATVSVTEVGANGAGTLPWTDTVQSYFGLRSVSTAHGAFQLNDRPLYVRSVLSQGYWPRSQLAATTDELRAEVQLILDLGFNAARVHQKVEDPRFLYWADRLGLMLWSELPSAYEFSPTAVQRATAEWTEVIRRDRSHPSIVTWVPLNESWGVQHIATDARAQAYAGALRHLTLALDGTRPVVSNDGWEHMDTDIVSIHDYEADGGVIRSRYADTAAVAALVNGIGPAGRVITVAPGSDRGQPVMLTEFGGVKFASGVQASDAWGYSTASSGEDFAARLTALFEAVQASSALAGFCYTQLTDTGQEVNGLLDADRQPKLPIAELRAIVTGNRA